MLYFVLCVPADSQREMSTMKGDMKILIMKGRGKCGARELGAIEKDLF